IPVERRGQAIRVMINLVNWQQEEPTDCGGERQLSMDGTSRVSREAQARICERLGVRFPGATRPSTEVGLPWSLRADITGCMRVFPESLRFMKCKAPGGLDIYNRPYKVEVDKPNMFHHAVPIGDPDGHRLRLGTGLRRVSEFLNTWPLRSNFGPTEVCNESHPHPCRVLCVSRACHRRSDVYEGHRADPAAKLPAVS